MTEEHPTRRELMRPVQLLGLSALAALFAGVVTLVSMGFFQQRFPKQSAHALDTALIVAGVTFIVTIVIISLLLLAVKPAEFTTVIDKPVLISHEEALAEHRAAEAKAAEAKRAGKAADGAKADRTEASAAPGTGGTSGDSAPGDGAASGTPAASGDGDPRSERGDSTDEGPTAAS